MRRPSLSLLVIFFSGLLFTSCYKNDLRTLYEQLTKQVSFEKLDRENSSLLCADGKTYYVTSSQNAEFVFALKNEKNFFYKADLSFDGVAEEDKHYIEWTPNSKEKPTNSGTITVTVKKDFLVKNEKNAFGVTITMGEWGMGSPSDRENRVFNDKINFKFAINTPPSIENLSLFKYKVNNDGEETTTYGLSCNLTNFTGDLTDAVFENILKSNSIKFIPIGTVFGDDNDKECTPIAIGINNLDFNTLEFIEKHDELTSDKTILYINTGKPITEDDNSSFDLVISNETWEKDESFKANAKLSASVSKFYKVLLYVNSITGNDEFIGDKNNPFATLSHAISMVNNSTQDWKIILQGDEFTNQKITIDNTIQAKSLTIEGAPDSIDPNAKTTLKGSNTAASGGSINAILTFNSTIPVTIKNIAFAQGDAGTCGLYLSGSNGEVTLENCTISNFTESGRYGHRPITCATGNASKLTLTGCAIENNNIIKSAIDLSGKGDVVFNNCTIKGNTAQQVSGSTETNLGGAIYAGTSCNLTLNDCTISGNGGTNVKGAGLYVKGTVTMNGGTIEHNESSENNGGGVYVDSSGTFILNSGTIFNNETTTASGKEFDGGGVYVENNGTFTMNGGTIKNNTATRFGGGVAVEGGTFNMAGGSIENNHANGIRGLAVMLTSSDSAPAKMFMYGDATIKDNGEEGETNLGSGIYILKTSYLYLGYSSAKNDGMPDAVSELTGSITGNKGDTAGIYLSLTDGADSKVYMNSGSICDNPAGRGVYVGHGTFTLSGSGSISGNNASDGAGVAVISKDKVKGTFVMSGGEISGNIAASSGGGVYVHAVDGSKVYPTFTMSGGEIKGNTGNKNGGGGVYVDTNCTFTMENATISGNFAKGDWAYGGGVHVAKNANFTMTSSTISGNKAIANSSKWAYGGGVYVIDGTFNMSGGTIEDNTATIDGTSGMAEGGGVNVGVSAYNDSSCNATFTMSGGTISNNTAKTSGAGLYVASGGYSASGGKVTATITDATITNNGNYDNVQVKNGGGIYCSYATLTLIDTQVNSNTAMAQNGQGGGIYINNAELTMTNSDITQNTSKASGGGVWIGKTSKAIFTMNGGKISENSTGTSGGGVLIANDGTYSDPSTDIPSVTIVNAEITNNGDYKSTKTYNGGGIYLGTAILTLKNTIVHSNSATTYSPGIYMFNRAQLKLAGSTTIGLQNEENEVSGITIPPYKLTDNNKIYLHVGETPSNITISEALTSDFVAELEYTETDGDVDDVQLLKAEGSIQLSDHVHRFRVPAKDIPKTGTATWDAQKFLYCVGNDGKRVQLATIIRSISDTKYNITYTGNSDTSTYATNGLYEYRWIGGSHRAYTLTSINSNSGTCNVIPTDKHYCISYILCKGNKAISVGEFSESSGSDW